MPSGTSLVRGTWRWQEGNKDQTTLRRLTMQRKGRTTAFLLCVNNEGYPASLEVGKVYKAIPDKLAERHRLVRVIDESGEDYLHSEKCFVPIDVPPSARKAL